MFILTKVADLVQIAPHDFAKKSLVAIEDNINAKFANKAIQRIGLCVCLYDLTWASEGLIGHGDGLVNVNVEFRLVVFRPFKGEVLFAYISNSNHLGIHLRTDFFFDITVPHDELPEGVWYDMALQLWVWSTDEGERVYYDRGEVVRFRVVDEQWHDQTPTKPIGRGEEPDEVREPPYVIKGSMKEAGLGVCVWWEQ